MLTLHELKEKLNEGQFIELTDGNHCVKWYPVEHLDLLKSYFPLPTTLRVKCEIIVNNCKSGQWLDGRHLRPNDYSRISFPESLLNWPVDHVERVANQIFSLQHPKLQLS
jgi:hypothetical protein